MKRILFAILFILAAMGLFANSPVDFSIEEIVTREHRFINVILSNRSPQAVNVRAESLEKIFLSIKINGIVRAEYKLKYFEKRLFSPGAKITFKTNFRSTGGERIEVIINHHKVFKETNYSNNRKSKQF